MFCSKCGTELVEGAAFCQKCGSKVHNVKTASEENVRGERTVEKALPEEITSPQTGEPGSDKKKVENLDVILNIVGPNKVKVIGVVRDWTGLGIKEAKDLVDHVPAILKKNVTEVEAGSIKAAFMREGAAVTFKDQKGNDVDIIPHCRSCGVVVDGSSEICKSCGRVLFMVPPYKDKEVSGQKPASFADDGIDKKELFNELKKMVREWYAGFSEIGKVGVVLGAFLVSCIVLASIPLIFSSSILLIILVACAYIAYQLWGSKWVMTFIYATKSKRLDLPGGMNTQAFLEALSGRFNYPYFKSVRCGTDGNCVIDGKYFTYGVMFNENKAAYLICTPDISDKNYCRILREAIAICSYINKFFNPAQAIDAMKDFNALKWAEGQRNRSAVVLSVAVLFLVIALAVQGGASGGSQSEYAGVPLSGSSGVAASSTSLDKSLYGRWRANDGTVIELSNDGYAQTSLRLQPWWAIGESTVLTWEATNGQLSFITSYVAEYKYTYYPKDYEDKYLADHLKVGSLTCHRVNGNTGDSMIGVWDDNDMGGPFFTFNADGTGAFANDKYTIWEADSENVYIYYDLITSFDYYVQGDSLQLFLSDGTIYFIRVGN